LNEEEANKTNELPVSEDYDLRRKERRADDTNTLKK